MRKFNKIHRHYRVYVEHVIGHLNQFRVLSTIFRHKRGKLAQLVELCAALSQRHVAMFDHL